MPYHIEYAKSGRAKCKGPKKTCPSPYRDIQSGELRLGSEIESTGFTGTAWRHWKCTTAKVLENLATLDNIEEDMVGFSELHDEDKERVKKAIEEGQVSETEGNDEKEEKKAEPKAKAKPRAKAKAKPEAKPEASSQAKAPSAAAKKEPKVDVAKPDGAKAEPKKRGRKPKAATAEKTHEPAETVEPSKPATKKRKETTGQEPAATSKKRASKKAAAA